MADSAPSYAPGTPIWVDLSTSDLQAAVGFYTGLFGWQAEDLGEEAGHYTMFRQDGKAVTAGGPLMSPQQPPRWSSYLASADTDATTSAVQQAGGQVVMGPMDVMEEGRMAVCMDPSGAAFSIWQPKHMRGAEIVNVPNSLTWNELNTRDLEKAKQFYPRVFGWGVKANPLPQGGEYVEWQIEGRSVAGGQQMTSDFPPQMASYWLVYFAVADTDAIVSKAQALGGRVVVPAMDIPQGRFAILTDAQGAAFGVIRNAR